MAKPAQAIRVTHVAHETGRDFPSVYLVEFTCGHPERFMATPRNAASAMFGTWVGCLVCIRQRDV